MFLSYRCEQQLLYNFSNDVYLSRAEPGVEVKVEEDVNAKVAKAKGSDIHLSRGECLILLILNYIVRPSDLNRYRAVLPHSWT